jgi:hypothetical protein
VFPFFQFIPAEYWPVIGVVIPLIQIAAAVHVLRTRNSFYWLWIIFFLPPLGAIIYFFVEIYPSLRSGQMSNPITALLDWWDPKREYYRLKENLELSDTVANRKALAEYHLKNGDYPQGIDLYRGCLRGPFKDDATVHLDLARAHFLAGEHEEAKQLLEKLRQMAPNYEPHKRDFLLARSLEELGDTQTAIIFYEKVQIGLTHEEARVRLALLLEERGERQKAKSIYVDVVRRMKKAAHHYRREQKEWWRTAQERLKELK